MVELVDSLCLQYCAVTWSLHLHSDLGGGGISSPVLEMAMQVSCPVSHSREASEAHQNPKTCISFYPGLLFLDTNVSFQSSYTLDYSAFTG